MNADDVGNCVSCTDTDSLVFESQCNLNMRLNLGISIVFWGFCQTLESKQRYC